MNPLTRAWQAVRASLFLKVTLVLLLTTVALNSLFDAAWRFGRVEPGDSPGKPRRGEIFIRDYVGYVLRDLGSPPDPAKARALAERGLWKLRFTPAVGSAAPAWSAGEDVPQPEELRDWQKGPDWGWKKGSFFVLAPAQGGTLLVLAEPFKGAHLAWTWRLALIAGVLLLLGLTWLAVRWLLLPLRWIDRGMAQVAAGDLGHRIPLRQRDELGRLAEQFNAMSARVQAMLQQRQQMLLDVSHELRTPLTRLKLGLEALPEGAERDSLAEDVAELEALVSELLEGARLEAGASPLKLEPVELGALAGSAAAGFAGREPGLRLDLAALPPLPADPGRLQRLLLNLLANAFTHGVPARGPVELSLRAEGGFAELCVRDHGPGLSEADRSQLFTPFFRADPSRARRSGGVGLGLHLCASIAKAHGGSLTAEAAEGGGLRLRLRLPLAEGPAAS